MKNYISYNLTKTIPGPKIKIKGPEEGFELIRQWTQEFTVGRYSEFSLHLTIPSKSYPNLDFLDNAFIRKPLTATYDDNDLCEWGFVQAVLPKLFDLIRVENDFFVRYSYSIMVNVDFVFLDKNYNLLNGQNLYCDEHSYFYCFIDQNKVSIEPFLRFPFEIENDDFREFYEFFKSHFPFKLSDKNLYLTRENIKAKRGLTTNKLRT